VKSSAMRASAARRSAWRDDFLTTKADIDRSYVESARSQQTTELSLKYAFAVALMQMSCLACGKRQFGMAVICLKI